MKEFYKVLLIAVIIVTITVGFSVRNFANANIPYDTKALSQELSNALKEWYSSIRATDYKNITVKTLLADDIQPVKIGDGKAEAVFCIKTTMIPKATLEEASQFPFLKGMQRYLNENRKKLTPAQIKTVELAIKARSDSFKDIVGKLHEENGIFKVVCNLASDGTIDKNSIKIFYDVSVTGRPTWENANNLFTSTITNSNEEEERGYKEVKDLIERLYSQNTFANQISPDSLYQNLYHGLNAAYYADDYTSEAPQSKTITCWIDNNPVVSNYTDTGYWNNAQYHLTQYSNGYYEQLACNNCADFVSQAMYYGGMQTDSYWNPQNRKTSVGGKWYWVNVGDLTYYMWKERGDWNDSSYSSLAFGDVAVHWGYDWYGNIVRDHIVIVDYPNYYGYYLFAGHTKDVELHYYPQTSQWFYYNVSCWRFGP